MNEHLSVRTFWWGAIVRVRGRLVRVILTLNPDPNKIIRDHLKESA